MFPKDIAAIQISWYGVDYPIQTPIYNTAVEEFVPHIKPQIAVYVDFDGYPQLLKRGVAALLPPPVVDDPPFGRKVLWFNTVLDAWIPPPPPPWYPSVNFTPPPSDDIIIWMWKRVL